MKTSFSNIILSGLMLVGSLSSCEKADDSIKEDEKGKTSDAAVTFLATMADELGDTKTTISNPDESTTAISWSQNDVISVNGNTLQVKGTASGKTATFFGGGEVPKKGGCYFASYNCGTVTIDAANKTQSFDFPITQTYNATSGSYGGLVGDNSIPMMAVSNAITDNTVTLEFKNACAIVDVKLKGPSTLSVAKIELSANSNCLGGTVSMDENSSLSFTSSSSTSSITLTMSSAITLNTSTYQHFCIKVPSLAADTELTVKIYKSASDALPYTSGTIKLSSALEFNQLVKVPITLVEDQLPGEFSVSATKKVRFSKGNLQYQKSTTGQFKFADEQWYHYGNSNGAQTGGGNTSASLDNSWIDLFEFGASGYKINPYTRVTSPDHLFNCEISGTAYDWGVFNYTSDGWRTLTKDEWTYLLGRSDCVSKYVKIHDVIGIILYPDVYSRTKETSGTSSSNCVTISDSDWSLDEAAGAVFLPGAGQRNTGNSTWLDNYKAVYWSTTSTEDQKAYAMYLDTPTSTSIYKNRAIAVRLVKDVYTPTTPQSGDYVDEYGINRGQGTVIGGYTWAPVNCGFSEPGLYNKNTGTFEVDNINGKLYQWGRKDGQGHAQGPTSGTLSTTRPSCTLSDGYIVYRGNCTSGNPDAKTYYWPAEDSKSWSSTSITTWENDPCPQGWKVPTKAQLQSTGYTFIKSGDKYYRYANVYGSYDATIGTSCWLYWVADSNNESTAYFYRSSDSAFLTWGKAYGMMVRCVKQ